MSEVEYCIWTYEFGQMDTSTDWGKLFDLINRQKKSLFPPYKFWIIPTSHVGKGKYRSEKQLNRELKKVLAEHERLKKETRILLDGKNR